MLSAGASEHVLLHPSASLMCLGNNEQHFINTEQFNNSTKKDQREFAKYVTLLKPSLSRFCSILVPGEGSRITGNS